MRAFIGRSQILKIPIISGDIDKKPEKITKFFILEYVYVRLRLLLVYSRATDKSFSQAHIYITIIDT